MTPMMMDGVRLMAVGMLAVFVFLTLLVALMHASAAFFRANARFFPEEFPEPAANRRGTRAGTNTGSGVIALDTSDTSDTSEGAAAEVALAIVAAEAMRRAGGAR